MNRCDRFCKHSVWISKRTLGRTPNPRDRMRYCQFNGNVLMRYGWNPPLQAGETSVNS